MIDWVSMTRSAQDLAAVMGTSFRAAAEAAIRAVNAYSMAVMGTVWTVDVETATHGDLREGETATRYSRVHVLARDEVEAKLVACQIAARDDRMPTRATVRSPQELREEEQARQITLAYRMDNPLASAMNLRRNAP
jgi:hypothetical protein